MFLGFPCFQYPRFLFFPSPSGRLSDHCHINARSHFEGQELGTKLGGMWRVEERMRMSGARTGDMYRRSPWHQCALIFVRLPQTGINCG